MADRAKPTRGQRAAELVERRAEMWRLRASGFTQEQIGKRYGISQQAVSEQLRRAHNDRPTETSKQSTAIELDKLDRMERAVLAVLERRHVTVSHGKVIEVWNEETRTEEPLLDDGPVLTAVDRLVRIAQHRADLLGLKAPTRVSVEAESLSQEIAGLLAAALDTGDDDDADA